MHDDDLPADHDGADEHADPHDVDFPDDISDREVRLELLKLIVAERGTTDPGDLNEWVNTYEDIVNGCYKDEGGG